MSLSHPFIKAARVLSPVGPTCRLPLLSMNPVSLRRPLLKASFQVVYPVVLRSIVLSPTLLSFLSGSSSVLALLAMPSAPPFDEGGLTDTVPFDRKGSLFIPARRSEKGLSHICIVQCCTHVRLSLSIFLASSNQQHASSDH